MIKLLTLLLLISSSAHGVFQVGDENALAAADHSQDSIEATLRDDSRNLRSYRAPDLISVRDLKGSSKGSKGPGSKGPKSKGPGKGSKGSKGPGKGGSKGPKGSKGPGKGKRRQLAEKEDRDLKGSSKGSKGPGSKGPKSKGPGKGSKGSKGPGKGGSKGPKGSKGPGKGKRRQL
jgi:hypothetical protein